MAKDNFRLPREFAEKWVAALRSGKYKQGLSSLANLIPTDVRAFDHSFCCIGVGCLVTGADVELLVNRTDITAYRTDRIGAFKNMPIELQYNGEIADDLVHRCVQMNDSDGRSFEEIADWIEISVEFY